MAKLDATLLLRVGGEEPMKPLKTLQNQELFAQIERAVEADLIGKTEGEYPC